LASDPLIGSGILRPFQRDVKQDWANDTGRRILDTSIGQILATMADSPLATGELPWRPEFGSVLYLLRNQNNAGQLGDLARRYVVDAIREWEPRVRVRGAQIQRFQAANQQGQNAMLIRVKYDIVGQGGSANEVVASGLETAVVV
jgi:phage baseplate assembly protein W